MATISIEKRLIIRQNCLAHADAWLGLVCDETDEDLTKCIATTEEKYFAFAERCYQWITKE